VWLQGNDLIPPLLLMILGMMREMMMPMYLWKKKIMLTKPKKDSTLSRKLK
jgi:hypothetical protein